jgi:hypothetical protein
MFFGAPCWPDMDFFVGFFGGRLKYEKKIDCRFIGAGAGSWLHPRFVGLRVE